MAYKYRVWLTVEYDQLVPAIKELTDSINGHMKDFGFNEEMHLRGKAVNIEVTSGEKLKPTEKRKFCNLALEHFNEKLPQYKWNVEKLIYEGEVDETGN